MTRLICFAIALSSLLLCHPNSGLQAEEALVAVASNFVATLKRLQPEFEQAKDHKVHLVSGSTGKLYAQIVRGAPFDVFLAADQERPRLLEESGLTVPASRFTYARGRLVLWSADAHVVGEGGVTTLRTANFRNLAIANPQIAPYGTAAREVLGALGLLELLQARLVMGENVGQAFAFVATGNAEIGLVALSSVQQGEFGGSRWYVPKDLHSPIRQDAVLLAEGASNPAAREFMDYLNSEEFQRSILAFGYSAGS